ncbi:YkvA family protein [Chloroflexota bacterium]
MSRWKEIINRFKEDTIALYFALKHPGVPWYAKLFIALVVGYALSPIDLIPDFIPVFGYLDDLIIIPLGFTLSIKMIPKDVLEECREKAKSGLGDGKHKNWTAALIILLIWLTVIFLIVRALIQ